MFTLNVEISSTDQKIIRAADELIVLVKNIAAGKPVAWVAAAPMTSTVLSWDTGYTLFASNSPNTLGGGLTMMATTPANGGYAYPFTTTGFGSGARRQDLGNTQYRVDNMVAASQWPALLFGLAQSVSINGNGSAAPLPLNAETVPAMQSTIQNASDSVTIWLQSGVSAGQIVSIPAPAAQMSMSGKLVVSFANTSTQTVRYSSSSGRFELVS